MTERSDAQSLPKALLGTAAVAAIGGVAWLVGRSGTRGGEAIEDDGPVSAARDGDAPIGRSVTIAKPPREELYRFWRDFKNLPRFMDNIEAVETLDDKRSRWTVAAPAGTSVELANRIVEDEPGRVIAWQSEEESGVRNAGRVEFLDAAPGRGTIVRVTIDYDPPGGIIAKAVAKALQREPAVQARRDLRRFKQLMETGEVTSSASPSGRKSESPTEQYA